MLPHGVCRHLGGALHLQQGIQQQMLSGERASRRSLFTQCYLLCLPQQRRQADEGESCATSRLRVEPAANGLPRVELGVGRQVGRGAFGEGKGCGVHRAHLERGEPLVPATAQLPRPVASGDEATLLQRLERGLTRRKVGGPALRLGDPGRPSSVQFAAQLRPVEDLRLGGRRQSIIHVRSRRQRRHRGDHGRRFLDIQEHVLCSRSLHRWASFLDSSKVRAQEGVCRGARDTTIAPTTTSPGRGSVGNSILHGGAEAGGPFATPWRGEYAPRGEAAGPDLPSRPDRLRQQH